MVGLRTHLTVICLRLHFVDEASRFHFATLVACKSDKKHLSLSSAELVKHLHKWTQFMGYPRRWHVDTEGCFKGSDFLDYCSKHGCEISMAAGQAHWQNGIVERHIGTFKIVFDKLLMGDLPRAGHPL